MSAMNSFKIGIDNYGLYPLDLSPIDTLIWAINHGAEGVAFSGLDKINRRIVDRPYLVDLLELATSNNMYLEWGGGQHIPRDMTSWGKKDLFEINRQAAVEAKLLGTRIIRSCSGGLMRWDKNSPLTKSLLKEMATVLKSQRTMLRDNNAILAIETHFEFTTFELLNLFEECDAQPGDYLGICLDTMNLLTMLEDPEMATNRILPWVVSTHIKDGGILKNEEGYKSFTTPIGNGIVNICSIIEMLGTLDREIFLSIEDHGGEFYIPVSDKEFRKKFPNFGNLEENKLNQLSALTEKKVKTGECNILSRENWPELCEKRMQDNILKLREIINDS